MIYLLNCFKSTAEHVDEIKTSFALTIFNLPSTAQQKKSRIFPWNLQILAFFSFHLRAKNHDFDTCGMFVNPLDKFLTDINECDEALHNCQHICTNDVGSFNCSCYTGFSFEDNTSKCVKVQGLLMKHI